MARVGKHPSRLNAPTIIVVAGKALKTRDIILYRRNDQLHSV